HNTRRKNDKAMSTKYCLLLCGIVAPLCSISQPQTLWDSVRAHDTTRGPLSISVSETVPARTVLELAAEADVVVEGVVADSRARLDSAERLIVTTHQVNPAVLFFAKSDMRAMTSRETIAVTQMGGNLEMLGQS